MSVPENLTLPSSGGTMVATIQEVTAMASEAKKQYISEYRKRLEKQYFFSLIRTTRPKMIDYLETVGNKQAYIRHLIAMDMKSKGLETDGLDGEMEGTP